MYVQTLVSDNNKPLKGIAVHCIPSKTRHNGCANLVSDDNYPPKGIAVHCFPSKTRHNGCTNLVSDDMREAGPANTLAILSPHNLEDMKRELRKWVLRQ